MINKSKKYQIVVLATILALAPFSMGAGCEETMTCTLVGCNSGFFITLETKDEDASFLGGKYDISVQTDNGLQGIFVVDTTVAPKMNSGYLTSGQMELRHSFNTQWSAFMLEIWAPYDSMKNVQRISIRVSQDETVVHEGEYDTNWTLTYPNGEACDKDKPCFRDDASAIANVTGSCENLPLTHIPEDLFANCKFTEEIASEETPNPIFELPGFCAQRNDNCANIISGEIRYTAEEQFKAFWDSCASDSETIKYPEIDWSASEIIHMAHREGCVVYKAIDSMRLCGSVLDVQRTPGVQNCQDGSINETRHNLFVVPKNAIERVVVNDQ